MRPEAPRPRNPFRGRRTMSRPGRGNPHVGSRASTARARSYPARQRRQTAPLLSQRMGSASEVASHLLVGASWREPMGADENAAIIRRGYEAFNSGDMETLTEIFDEGAVWQKPGRSSLA